MARVRNDFLGCPVFPVWCIFSELRHRRILSSIRTPSVYVVPEFRVLLWSAEDLRVPTLTSAIPFSGSPLPNAIYTLLWTKSEHNLDYSSQLSLYIWSISSCLSCFISLSWKFVLIWVGTLLWLDFTFMAVLNSAHPSYSIFHCCILLYYNTIIPADLWQLFPHLVDKLSYVRDDELPVGTLALELRRESLIDTILIPCGPSEWDPFGDAVINWMSRCVSLV